MIKNLKKYWSFLYYYSTTLLKLKTSGSYLGMAWLIIEPLMFMLVYTFVVAFIFNVSRPNYHLFVFVGLISWKIFAGTILMGATVIVRNKSIINQVSFKKFVYPTTYTLVGIYEFLISFGIFLVLLLLSDVQISWHLIEFIPITGVLIILTYGITLFIAHIGVYIFDLRNVLNILLRMFFFLSPVMWVYSTFTHKYVQILKINPISVIIVAYRKILLLGESPDYLALGAVLVLGLVIVFFGYKLIDRKESDYGKII